MSEAVHSNGHGSHATGTPAAPPDFDWLQNRSLVVGGVGLAVLVLFALIRFVADGTEGLKQFFLAYTVAYVFLLSLPLGSMALLMISYLCKATWGLLERRVLEACTRTLPMMAILFLPIIVGLFLGEHSPYWWVVEDESAIRAKFPNNETALHEIQHKQHDYLNVWFFVLRAAIYFSIWYGFCSVLNRWGAEMERTGDTEKYLEKLKNVSGPGLMIYAVTNTLAATDWIMSMEMTWASTMFPVIYSVNQLLTGHAFAVAMFFLLIRPHVGRAMTPKYQIDMGSFMLALTLFWTYTNFSQWMLVWVANLPEEIPFYLKRTRGGWEIISWSLGLFHFAAPFGLLLFRDVKMHPKRITAVAIGLLVMCAIDVFWWIEPVHSHEGQYLYLLMDLGALAGLGGVWFYWFLARLRETTLLPTHELKKLEVFAHGH